MKALKIMWIQKFWIIKNYFDNWIEYILSTYYVPGTMPDTGYREVNKMDIYSDATGFII